MLATVQRMGSERFVNVIVHTGIVVRPREILQNFGYIWVDDAISLSGAFLIRRNGERKQESTCWMVVRIMQGGQSPWRTRERLGDDFLV